MTVKLFTNSSTDEKTMIIFCLSIIGCLPLQPARAQEIEQLVLNTLQHVSDLTTIITAGKLRMSDEERLKAIDTLYDDISDELLFVW